MIYTTLNNIKSKNPCKSGWEVLLKHLNKTEADDEALSFKTILESNGVIDAIWALRSIEGYDKEIRLFAVACARAVQHLMTDKRSIKALDVAENYARGECTKAELEAARVAAWDAARVAAEAAWDAAWCAAGAAAWCATAGATAGAADAAVAAAREDELKWQTEEFKRLFCSE